MHATPAPRDFFPEARAIVAAQVERREQRQVGISWSGLTTPTPEPETVEAVVAKLEQRAAEAAAWRLTPRGRLYMSICELEKLGYGDAAYRLEGEYRRSLANPDEPLNVRAVGACLAILNGINHPDAAAGRDALAELLLGERLAEAA